MDCHQRRGRSHQRHSASECAARRRTLHAHEWRHDRLSRDDRRSAGTTRGRGPFRFRSCATTHTRFSNTRATRETKPWRTSSAVAVPATRSSSDSSNRVVIGARCEADPAARDSVRRAARRPTDATVGATASAAVAADNPFQHVESPRDGGGRRQSCSGLALLGFWNAVPRAMTGRRVPAFAWTRSRPRAPRIMKGLLRAIRSHGEVPKWS